MAVHTALDRVSYQRSAKSGILERDQWILGIPNSIGVAPELDYTSRTVGCGNNVRRLSGIRNGSNAAEVELTPAVGTSWTETRSA